MDNFLDLRDDTTMTNFVNSVRGDVEPRASIGTEEESTTNLFKSVQGSAEPRVSVGTVNEPATSFSDLVQADVELRASLGTENESIQAHSDIPSAPVPNVSMLPITAADEVLQAFTKAAYQEFLAKLACAQTLQQEAIARATHDVGKVKASLVGQQAELADAQRRHEEAKEAAEAAERTKGAANRKADKHSGVLDVFEQDELEDEVKEAMTPAYNLALGYEEEAKRAEEDAEEAQQEQERREGICDGIEEVVQKLERQMWTASKGIQQCKYSTAIVRDFIDVICEATTGTTVSIIR